jgi:hypothetical protein
MLTIESAQSILDRVRYKDWKFIVRECLGSLDLQVRFMAPDSHDGHLDTQGGRRWLLSHHMTDSEVVQTAMKAVLTAEEHEAREMFLYRGKAIFGPHLDVETLVEMAERQDRREDRRAEAS